jgi:acyl transferase domain-containing protein
VIEAEPTVSRILATVDSVAAEYGWDPVSTMLSGAAAGGEDTGQVSSHLWLGFFATSVSVSALLANSGVPCDVVLGHSAGEISALVAAGCLSVEDGTRVMCERTKAVEEAGLTTGAMVAVGAPARRVAQLCEVVRGGSLAVAVDNGPGQSVVSGEAGAVGVLEDLAMVLGWQTTRLGIPDSYHNPRLAGAAGRLAKAVAHARLCAPRVPLYSPQLGRYVVTAGDVRELIEGLLVLPVRFYGALTALFGDGMDTFVEVGAKHVVSDVVSVCLPASARAVPVLPRRMTWPALEELIASLVANPGHVRSPVPTGGTLVSQEVPTTRRAVPAGEGRSLDVPAPVPVSVPAPAVGSAAPARPGHKTSGGRGQKAEADPRTALPTAVADEPSSPGPRRQEADRSALPGEAELLVAVRQVYADVLQYPLDVIEDDVHLEAELGVSSLQQTQVVGRLLDQYRLQALPSGMRLISYRTVSEVAGLLRQLANA